MSNANTTVNPLPSCTQFETRLIVLLERVAVALEKIVEADSGKV